MSKNELTDDDLLEVAKLLGIEDAESWDIATLRLIVKHGYGKEGELATQAVLDAFDTVLPIVQKRGVYQEHQPVNLSLRDWHKRVDFLIKVSKRHQPKGVEYTTVGAGTFGTDAKSPFVIAIRRKQAA